MSDKNLIGRVLSKGTIEVEKGRLRSFAKATGQLDPIYSSEAAAKEAGHPSLPVPPSFLFCLNSETFDLTEALKVLQMDLGRILHAEQSFDYHKMAYAGDELTFETKVADVYEKKGGALLFVVQETRVTNRKGERVADMRCTLVERRG